MEGEKSKSCCPSGVSCGESNGKTICKCGPGWTCEIWKIEPSQPFYKCTEPNCVCITEDSKSESSERTQVVEREGAYCYCGEGYACSVKKTEGPGAGKVFFECGNGCECKIPASGSQVVVKKDA